MSDFRISQADLQISEADIRISEAALTASDMMTLAGTCQNTTVGPNKYQLYCVTRTNLGGQCTSLPSSYTAAGKLDCFTLTSQASLRSLYSSTGMACAIQCYYPIPVSFPTFSIPPLNLPSLSFTFSSARSTPTPTRASGGDGGNDDGIDLSDIADSGNNGDNPLIDSVGVGNRTTTSGSFATTDPNLMLTFMAVFAIMILFFRRAI